MENAADTALQQPESANPDARATPLPTPAELAALGQSGPLLRFASEKLKQIDGAVVESIATAVDAAAKKTWSPEISSKFWLAFNALCQQIQPVTMDCLSAVARNIERRRLLPWGRPYDKESLGERSSRRYMRGLIGLLLLLVVFQFFVWMYTSLSTEIDGRTKELSTAQTQLSQRCKELGIAQGATPSEKFWLDPKQQEAFAAIEMQQNEIMAQSELLADAALRLQRVSRATGRVDISKTKWNQLAETDWAKNCSSFSDNVRNIALVAQSAASQGRFLASTFLQFILPIMLGAIGALAYVLRNTSEQIKDTTYTTTSPVRNSVRVMLGALMGVIIGLFNAVSQSLSLSPLALAFLAGYGVEGVFTIFDALIERLKQPAPPKQGPGQAGNS